MRLINGSCAAALMSGLLAAGPATVSAEVILIDYGDMAARPTLGGAWNEVPDIDSSGFALVDSTGAATGVTVSISLGGGNTFEFDQGAWGNGDVDWIDGDAVNDVFGFNGASTVTFNGLIPNGAYSFDHLAARGSDFGTADYSIGGSFGDSIPNGDDFSAFSDGWTNGSYITWNSVIADGAGVIVLDIAPNTDAFGYLSASRLTRIPGPTTPAVALVGLMLSRRGRRRRK